MHRGGYGKPAPSERVSRLTDVGVSVVSPRAQRRCTNSSEGKPNGTPGPSNCGAQHGVQQQHFLPHLLLGVQRLLHVLDLPNGGSRQPVLRRRRRCFGLWPRCHAGQRLHGWYRQQLLVRSAHLAASRLTGRTRGRHTSLRLATTWRGGLIGTTQPDRIRRSGTEARKCIEEKSHSWLELGGALHALAVPPSSERLAQGAAVRAVREGRPTDIHRPVKSSTTRDGTSPRARRSKTALIDDRG